MENNKRLGNRQENGLAAAVNDLGNHVGRNDH